jgi:hypothetical protein
MKSNKLLCGVGINDADYVVKSQITTGYVEGKQKRKQLSICPFYAKWKSMIERCYSVNYQNRYPTYKDCAVCDEWLFFSKFKAWMEQQDWKGKHLDKDLLLEGNKLYSPETCVFVDQKVNNFITDAGAIRGELPVGVSWHKRDCKYIARISDGGKLKVVGYFDCPNEAHEAWRKAKHEIALVLAKEQTDLRVVDALYNRFKQEEVIE